MAPMPPFLRRRHIIGGATATVLVGCGGSGSSSDSNSMAKDVVYLAQPDSSSILLSRATTDRSYTASFHRPTASTAVPTSIQVESGGTQADLVFDEQGRASVVRDIKSGAQTQFAYPSETSSIASQYNDSGEFVSGVAYWTIGGKYFAGTVSRADARVPEDVSSVQDISDAVNAKLTELRNLPTARTTSLRFDLLRLLPLPSAYAQSEDQALRQIVLGFVAQIVSTVFPSLVVGLTALAFGLSPLVAAVLALGTFLLLFPDVSRAAGFDRSRAEAMVREFVSRPYRGSLVVTGGMSIPESAGGPCTGSLSVVGSLSVTLLSGTTASAVVDGTEYITTPCFTFVFRKRNNGATLTRTGNSLSGTSPSSFGNPWVYSLTVSSDLSTVQGTVNYPYNAPNGLRGSAAGAVVLRR